MSSSYSSLHWVWSHWTHFTVCLCILLRCIVLLHMCCIIVTYGVDHWSLILEHLPSVLWHCSLGHLIRKIPSPIWPIMCWFGTLNLTQPYFAAFSSDYRLSVRIRWARCFYFSRGQIFGLRVQRFTPNDCVKERYHCRKRKFDQSCSNLVQSLNTQ